MENFDMENFDFGATEGCTSCESLRKEVEWLKEQVEWLKGQVESHWTLAEIRRKKLEEK